MSDHNSNLHLPTVVVQQKPELRVLQVFSALGMGGAETWLMALLRYFAKDSEALPFRVRFDVLLTGGEKSVFDEEAQALGSRLFYVRYSQKRLLPFRRELKRILKRGRYHAIHDHQSYAAGIHFLLGVGQLPPVRIAHFHNPLCDLQEFMDRRTYLVTEVEKRLLAVLATHITATSNQMLVEHGVEQTLFRKTGREVVHCGFDVMRFHASINARALVREEFGWKANSQIMLFVGRIGSDTYISNDPDGVGQGRKNPFFAVNVAAEVIARNPGVRLLLVGGGDYATKNIQEQVRSRGLSDQIRFIGIRNDVPRLMAGADLFLFPSRAEGLGMVAVEAQAMGLRVLASDAVPRECVAVPGMVTFCSLDAPLMQWAQAALRLLECPRLDPQECNSEVSNSSFSIENSAAHLIRLYSGGHQQNSGKSLNI